MNLILDSSENESRVSLKFICKVPRFPNQGPGVGVEAGVPVAEVPFNRFFFFFFLGMRAGFAP